VRRELQIRLIQENVIPLSVQTFSTHCRGRPPLDDDVSGLHEEGAQVFVPPLGDLAELGAIAGRLLLRDKAEPGGEARKAQRCLDCPTARATHAGGDGSDRSIVAPRPGRAGIASALMGADLRQLPRGL
jgi:hypothetical protein